MKQTVDFHMFAEAFRAHDRQAQFSYDALRELYRYYEGVEEWCDHDMELDVVAICCDWTEVSDMEELRREYRHVLEDLPEDASWSDCAEALSEHTTVLEVQSGATYSAIRFEPTSLIIRAF